MTHGDHRTHYDHKRSFWQTYRKRETGLPSYAEKQLDKLQQRLSGRLVLAGEPGYNDDRMVFMHTFQHYPQVIIFCICETDVIAALKFARKSGLQVACRSGGHCTAGYSVNDQVVIDVSGLNHISIDTDAPAVRVGPGVDFRALNRMLDHYDLHLPGGGCETVNVAGFMMGGGYGFSSRLFGMNCDRVRAVRMVLPSGEVVRADADENADLLWAVRGGTGNQFGVLIEIEYDPVRLDHNFFGFGLRWNLRHEDEIATAARVLEMLQAEYSNSGPPKMGHQSLLMYLPDEKHPDGLIPSLCLRGLYDGTEAEAKAALGPLLDTITKPKTQVEIWTHKHGYTRLNELLLQTVWPQGNDMPNVSMNTKPLVEGWLVKEHHSADRWRNVIDLFLRAPDKTCFIAMEYYGGAIAEPEPDAMAFCHRDASVDLFSWAFWTFDTHRDATISWLDEFGEMAGDMGYGRRYQNYPRRGTVDPLEAYFGQNLPRLREIKAKCDPKNMFWFEQSLGPKPTPRDLKREEQKSEAEALRSEKADG